MKIKSEKGFTGIDVAVSVIVLVIFVSIIAGLSYKFASKAKEVYCKSEAVRLAIKSIEEIKEKYTGQDFNELKTTDYEEIKILVSEVNNQNETVEKEKATFYKKIIVEDKKNDDDETIVKKVVVSIKYVLRTIEKEISLSTIIVKER